MKTLPQDPKTDNFEQWAYCISPAQNTNNIFTKARRQANISIKLDVER